jgi:hypothetical protein
MPAQQPQQPQQLQNNKNIPPSSSSSSVQQTSGSSNNSNSLINNMNNLNNAVNNNNNVNQNAPAPQIQHQLIESFRIAVTSGLLSADLLNTRLPSDVLTMLYQLFQVQSQYMNLNSKMEPLLKRRAQMIPQQFKQEHDSLNQELQACRDHLLSLKTKINNAHMLLKAKMQQQPFDQQQHNEPSLMAPLNQLSIKDPQLSSNTPLSTPGGQQPPRTLPKLINDPKNLNSSLGRQTTNNSGQSQQSISKPHQQQQLYQQFNNFGQQNWPNFRNDDSNFNNDPMPLPFDDRITPFIPGQPWTGPGHSSIEDDPNCTPGSVTKSLLHDIDPESRLTNLQHKATWSETSITTTNAITANSRQNSRGSWSSGGYTTPSLANTTTSSIGEQLWGVRGGNGGGGNNNINPSNRNNLPFNPSTNAAPGNRNQNFNPNPNNSNNTNSSSNVNMNSHFYRSNSWNISPQQTGNNNNNSSSSNSGNSSSYGQYLLLKNIPIQV